MMAMSVVETASGSGRRFDSLQQEAYLALWRTYDRLQAIEESLFKSFGLTAQQYNLLRLLRAGDGVPIPTLSVVERLVSRAPDVTRMIDRLEARGWLARSRSSSDRRAVLVAITSSGIELLDQIAQPLRQCHERQLGHLSSQELESLVVLLRKVRAPHELDNSTWK
jgi:DNA-binding MarR family transcriptional regulator